MKMMKLFALSAILCSPVALRADHSFKISEFAGEYVTTMSTNGTPNISTAIIPVQLAPAGNVIARGQFDKKGHGKITFFSQSIFTGPIPSTNPPIPPSQNLIVSRTDAGFPVLRVRLHLKHKKEGAGTITIYDYPVQGTNLLTDFVAVKSKGKVVRIFQNAITVPASLGSLAMVSERQFQDD